MPTRVADRLHHRLLQVRPLDPAALAQQRAGHLLRAQALPLQLRSQTLQRGEALGGRADEGSWAVRTQRHGRENAHLSSGTVAGKALLHAQQAWLALSCRMRLSLREAMPNTLTPILRSSAAAIGGDRERAGVCDTAMRLRQQAWHSEHASRSRVVEGKSHA